MSASGAGGTWSVTEVLGNPDIRRRSLKRSPLIGSITIFWTHASTTFDGAWLGFDTSADQTETDSAFDAPYGLGRLWRWPALTRQRQLKKRRARASRSVSGRVEERTRGGWTEWLLQFACIPGALVFAGDAADADLTAQVKGMTAGDPNAYLEALWELLPTRRPLRFVPDESDLSAYHHIRVHDSNFLSGIPFQRRQGALVAVDVNIPATEYVP